MKECKYCGTKYKDELDVCPNCGGNLIVTAEEIAKAAELAQKEKENQKRSVTEPENHLKKLIGIIAGVVVAIIVIVIGASYAHNHRAVNGDLSRVDMADAYEQGVVFCDNGDYASAITELGKVSEESKYYGEASAMLQNAVAIYCDDALSKASAYANTSDYKMACSILENALQVVPANSTLTAELASYQETVRNQLRSSALEAVERSIGENDYPTAIQTLSATVEELNGDIELNALLEKNKGEYRDMIIAQADEALESDGYEVAIGVITQGLSVLENDSAFLTAKEEYATYAPVPLDSLATISKDGDIYNRQEQTDVFGNTYSVNYFVIVGYNSKETCEKYLNKMYSEFRATFAPTSDWEADDYESIRMSVYGDGQLLASYDLKHNSLPIDVSVNVSDVDILMLKLYSPRKYYWDGWCSVLIADPVVIK